MNVCVVYINAINVCVWISVDKELNRFEWNSKFRVIYESFYDIANQSLAEKYYVLCR